MALTARNNVAVATLMRKSINRQTTMARMKFKLKENQVHNILSCAENNIGPYNDLVEILKTYPINDENLRLLLNDCMLSILLLGREMHAFVEAVCNVEWINKNEENVQLFSRFIIELVTAHTYHAPIVMKSLVMLFKNDGVNWSEHPSEALANSWSNVHSIIAQIVSAMPLTSDLLLQSITEHFPYYKAGVYPNRAFVHNLIWITKYIPSMMEQIMSVVVNRMVIIDVNIVDQEKNKQQLETQFPMDIDMDDNDTGLKDTLDFCMLELLHWLQDDRDVALQIFCNIFEKIILPTYGIKHVQFLVLYTISINQQCADKILNKLWLITAGMHGLGPAAVTTRRTAASHLAGLLARCLRMPNSRLVLYLKNMADWCHSYVTATQESTTAVDNGKIHGAFYGVCHAIFYLIAFKHQQLFTNKESLIFIESLNLPRLVTCNLNPLRTCPPQVTRAFSSVTRSHQVVYCEAIVEKNARHTLQSTVEEQYEEWFPYDPYTLERSGEIIWPLCTEYKMWLHDGEDESQYSNHKRKLESEDDVYLMSTTPSSKLASSLSNCISPGFKSM